MARKWSNLNIPGALHFVTGNVLDRDQIFRDESCCREFTGTLNDLMHSWPAKLIAYVLMPDHFHLIVNPKDGDIQGFTRTLKGKLSIKVIELTGDRFLLPKPRADGSTHQMWQESFKAVALWSAWMIWQKINYIHANPVKAKLVTSAKDYKWSSFGAYYLGSQEPLVVDHEWWWPDDSIKLSKVMKELGWRTYHKRSLDK